MMNLILGIVWLVGGITLLTYEFVTGETFLHIRYLNISSAWFLFLLASWNFARWYSSRSGRAEQNALRIAHEERLRKARYRERPAEIDPTFDFSEKPTPPRNLTDLPPSNN
jgi:hypothetical protein